MPRYLDWRTAGVSPNGPPSTYNGYRSGYSTPYGYLPLEIQQRLDPSVTAYDPAAGYQNSANAPVSYDFYERFRPDRRQLDMIGAKGSEERFKAQQDMRRQHELNQWIKAGGNPEDFVQWENSGMGGQSWDSFASAQERNAARTKYYMQNLYNLINGAKPVDDQGMGLKSGATGQVAPINGAVGQIPEGAGYQGGAIAPIDSTKPLAADQAGLTGQLGKMPGGLTEALANMRGQIPEGYNYQGGPPGGGGKQGFGGVGDLRNNMGKPGMEYGAGGNPAPVRGGKQGFSNGGANNKMAQL